MIVIKIKILFESVKLDDNEVVGRKFIGGGVGHANVLTTAI